MGAPHVQNTVCSLWALVELKGKELIFAKGSPEACAVSFAMLSNSAPVCLPHFRGNCPRIPRLWEPQIWCTRSAPRSTGNRLCSLKRKLVIKKKISITKILKVKLGTLNLLLENFLSILPACHSFYIYQQIYFLLFFPSAWLWCLRPQFPSPPNITTRSQRLGTGLVFGLSFCMHPAMGV